MFDDRKAVVYGGMESFTKDMPSPRQEGSSSVRPPLPDIVPRSRSQSVNLPPLQSSHDACKLIGSKLRDLSKQFEDSHQQERCRRRFTLSTVAELLGLR